MAEVVYLHVGAPKTGTTYLQDRLSLNRSELTRHDVHYPIGLRSDMFAAAVDLVDKPWGGQLAAAQGEWDALVGRVRRADGTAVVSHEILSGASQERIRKAMQDLEPAEVHLVYSARDLGRQIPAEWQELVKHRHRASFADFLARVQASPRTGATLWFWRAQGLPDVLSRWAAGLPPNRVHLVTVPQAGAPRDELWRRYCRVFQIDPAWAPQESDARNVSIGAAEAMLVRKLNRRLKRAGVSSADYRRLVRQVVVHQTLAERKSMTKVTLPPHAYDWADEVATEWIEWAEGAGIEVVGDLSELRAVRPAEDAVWSNPDRVKPGKVLNAALDALVAVIEEAASRPDPEEHLTTKIGRAAKRLRGQ